jgi:class 3 adenylate cyclase
LGARVVQRATDAVVAALEAQQAVQSEEWPKGIELSARVAVLTGEADAADRDYRSPAVNRCAKLRRRPVGGQVLVSETTYSIVADILRKTSSCCLSESGCSKATSAPRRSTSSSTRT